jgi:hypothetical protein
MIEQLINLPEPVLTVLILGLLVGTLVLAFKVMEMIFDTIVIAVLSATLYIGLTYATAAPFQLNDLLLFSFLGASVYMLYSFLATIISTTESVLKVPLKFLTVSFGGLRSGLRKTYRRLKREIRSLREERIEEDEGERSTKEVVLNSD